MAMEQIVLNEDSSLYLIKASTKKAQDSSKYLIGKGLLDEDLRNKMGRTEISYLIEANGSSGTIDTLREMDDCNVKRFVMGSQAVQSVNRVTSTALDSTELLLAKLILNVELSEAEKDKVREIVNRRRNDVVGRSEA